MKKNLITGGVGFIGHHLIRALSTSDSHNIVVDNGQSCNWQYQNFATEVFKVGIEELSFDEMCDLLQGVDCLYHLAAEKYNSSSMTPERVLEVNVNATDRLFRAAVKTNVPRVVFTSSLYAYGNLGPSMMSEEDLPNPRTHYGISKLAGEYLLKTNTLKSKTKWNIARLMFIYGPEQFALGGYKSVIVKNFERILTNELPLINGDGMQSLDYVYVDDCVEALLKLADSHVSEQVVNVSSGTGTSILELTKLMNQVANHKNEFEFAPPDWTAGSYRVGRNEKITELFGWKPTVTLLDGLQRTWNSLRD